MFNQKGECMKEYTIITLDIPIEFLSEVIGITDNLIDFLYDVFLELNDGSWLLDVTHF